MHIFTRTVTWSTIAACAALAACSSPAVDLRPKTGPTASPTPIASATATAIATATPTATPTGATPTATPTPSPTPSPVASAAFVLNPNPVVIAAVGSGCSETTATFTVSEAGYTGTFSGVIHDTSIATVALTSPGTFTVTAVTTTNGPAGTTITVSDTNGHSTTENVTVSTCLP